MPTPRRVRAFLVCVVLMVRDKQIQRLRAKVVVEVHCVSKNRIPMINMT